MPTTDQNSNGIDDICEKDMAVSTSFTGNWYSASDNSGSFSGNLNRSSNSNQGFYNGTIFNTIYGNVNISGNWYVLTMSGTINYEKSGGNFTANYTITAIDQSPENTFSSTYEIIDQDNIRIYSTDEFPTTVFSRNGNTYSAVVTLTDGSLDTFWPDYQKWLYVIEDNNDTDQDGIPDLSDEVDNIKHAQPWIPLLLLDD